MKRVIAASVMSAIVLIITLLTAGIVSRAKEAEIIRQRISTLPEFTLSSINGDILNTGEIERGPLLIVYFHPECEHCRSEIESLLGSTLPGRHITVIMISYADHETVSSYIGMIERNCEAKTWIVSDTALIFRGIYGTDIIPSTYIYDEDLRLVRSFKGETSLEGILKYLEGGI